MSTESRHPYFEDFLPKWTPKMKNHQLLIMGPRRNIVCEMMAQLDEVSQDVPEGFYLQFCGHLKRLHELGDHVTRTSTAPPQQRVRRGIPARIRTEAERQADRAAHDRIVQDLFGPDVEYRPTSPARHPRRL
jgi:hypothetical protein